VRARPDFSVAVALDASPEGCELVEACLDPADTPSRMQVERAMMAHRIGLASIVRDAA
jgi:hypothetical protein